jgi:hypothetical protein
LRLGVPSLIPASRVIARMTFFPMPIRAAHVVQDRAPRHQERAPEPTLPALYMHLAEPAGAHDLRHPAGVPAAPRRRSRIVAIGLVRHGLHRRVRLAGLDADRRPAGLCQPVVQPGGERARLHAHPRERQIEPLQRIVQGVRRTLRPNLPHDRPVRSATQMAVSYKDKDTSKPA